MWCTGNLEHLPCHSHQPSPSPSTQYKDPTTVFFWIFQEFFSGKLFSCDVGVVWQTDSGSACCLLVMGLGVLGVSVYSWPTKNPSTHTAWCLYTILGAQGLFEVIFEEKTGASCVSINVGLDILAISGTWGHDLVAGLAMLGSNGPNDIKGLSQPT